uniref:Uncharacterized protein n=1 Tax=Globodera rostochiensis TaxID=31243 RepID=A0A914H0Y2_GLORO
MPRGKVGTLYPISDSSRLRHSLRGAQPVVFGIREENSRPFVVPPLLVAPCNAQLGPHLRISTLSDFISSSVLLSSY